MFPLCRYIMYRQLALRHNRWVNVFSIHQCCFFSEHIHLPLSFSWNLTENIQICSHCIISLNPYLQLHGLHKTTFMNENVWISNTGRLKYYDWYGIGSDYGLAPNRCRAREAAIFGGPPRFGAPGGEATVTRLSAGSLWVPHVFSTLQPGVIRLKN